MRLRRLSVLLVFVVLLTAACSGGGPSSPRRSPGGATPAAPATGRAVAADGGCLAQPQYTALPTWARAGFSDPAGPVAHVLGARGTIVAIVWAPADPLHAPPLASRNNKILWVSKVPPPGAAPLLIRATLASSGQTVDRTVPGGPGPSIIDLPAAGCWTMNLTWSGHADQVKLRYVG